MNAQELLVLLNNGAKVRSDNNGCNVILPNGETLPTQASTINAMKARTDKTLLIRRYLMPPCIWEVMLPHFDDLTEQRWITRTLITPKGV